MQIKFNYLSLSLRSTVSLWIVSHLTFKIQSKTNYFYKKHVDETGCGIAKTKLKGKCADLKIKN